MSYLAYLKGHSNPGPTLSPANFKSFIRIGDRSNALELLVSPLQSPLICFCGWVPTYSQKKVQRSQKNRRCSYGTPRPLAFALRRRINGGGLQAKQAPDVGIHEKEMGPSSVFWAEETRNRAPVLELPVVSYAVGAAGFWRPKKQVPKIVILVF